MVTTPSEKVENAGGTIRFLRKWVVSVASEQMFVGGSSSKQVVGPIALLLVAVSSVAVAWNPVYDCGTTTTGPPSATIIEENYTCIVHVSTRLHDSPEQTLTTAFCNGRESKVYVYTHSKCNRVPWFRLICVYTAKSPYPVSGGS